MYARNLISSDGRATVCLSNSSHLGIPFFPSSPTCLKFRIYQGKQGRKGEFSRRWKNPPDWLALLLPFPASYARKKRTWRKEREKNKQNLFRFFAAKGGRKTKKFFFRVWLHGLGARMVNVFFFFEKSLNRKYYYSMQNRETDMKNFSFMSNSVPLTWPPLKVPFLLRVPFWPERVAKWVFQQSETTAANKKDEGGGRETKKKTTHIPCP